LLGPNTSEVKQRRRSWPWSSLPVKCPSEACRRLSPRDAARGATISDRRRARWADEKMAIVLDLRNNKITSWRRGGHHAGLFVLCRTEGSRASRAERGGRTERRPEGSHRRARTEVGSRLVGSGAAQRREGGRCWPVPVRCVKVTHRVRMMGCSCGLG